MCITHGAYIVGTGLNVEAHEAVVEEDAPCEVRIADVGSRGPVGWEGRNGLGWGCRGSPGEGWTAWSKSVITLEMSISKT